MNPGRPTRHGWARAWPWVKYVGGLALAALALWALAGRRSELSGASSYLAHLHWWWVVLATVSEAGSLVAFAVVQRRALEAGNVDMSTSRLTAVTAASTAMANSMPAGPVVASVFAYRQYRRSGADEALAVWTLVAVFVVASVTLALFAAVGVAVAGAEGAGLDLVGVTVAVLIGALALGAVFLQRRALAWVVSGVIRVLRLLVRWPKGELGAHVDDVVGRLTVVSLDLRQVLSLAFWGIANWFLDCACLAMAFLALGVAIPWRGLVLAYGAAQLAVNLPITPGGLGVVEGSLTIALVAFGGAETSTIATVLLYRLLSFWLELPVGWVTWGVLVFRHHREPAVDEVVVVGPAKSAASEDGPGESHGDRQKDRVS